MVAALFGIQKLFFPCEIPLFSIDFWNVQWAISPLVPWQLVAHFVRTGLIYQFHKPLLSLAHCLPPPPHITTTFYLHSKLPMTCQNVHFWIKNYVYRGLAYVQKIFFFESKGPVGEGDTTPPQINLGYKSCLWNYSVDTPNWSSCEVRYSWVIQPHVCCYRSTFKATVTLARRCHRVALVLKGHWTSIASSPNFFKKKKKVGIFIPLKVLVWRNMNISSIFYFSKSTSINTQYSSLWDTLKMMLFTKYLIK